jgi:FAD/FMN-containing dehydrogenase
VSAPSVADLRNRLQGSLLTPEDAGYDEARALYNGMFDKHPAAVARCVDAADVAAVVAYARSSGLDLAVRGGGHNGAGLGSVDGGLVADLSSMRDVRVDETGTVHVGGGALLRDLDAASHSAGGAVPVGILGTTGVGGLTLGGGVGNLTRTFGLTIDSLVGADVVLADGSRVTADEDHDPDLFWALRGGGGNFGVVTAFRFRMHPVTSVVAGPMLWSIDQTPEVLSAYREFLGAAPDELGGYFSSLVVPPVPPFPEELRLTKVCGVVWCYTGPVDHAADALAPMRTVGKIAFDGVTPMPLTALQSLFDPLFPPGEQWYWRTALVREIDGAAVAVHAEFGTRIPTPKSSMHLFPVDGAASRVGTDDTAWAFRDARWCQVILGVDPDPANADLVRSWATAYSDAVAPHTMGGGYVNMMMAEGDALDRVRRSYGDHWERLVRIKHAYDPENLFHVNQNIPPGGS